MINATLLILAFLAAPPAEVPPSTTIPAGLVICIEQATKCSLSAQTEDEFGQCIEDYEDCSYDYPEAHQPSCQMHYVWCRLEPQEDPAWQDYCEEVYRACPL